MSAARPQELAPAFAAAINGGDLRAALELWDERARVVGPGGEAIVGRAEIERLLGSLIDHGARVQIELEALYESGGVALASGTVTITAADGFATRSAALAVYVRGHDGRWRLAIDAPWGLPARPAAADDGRPPPALTV